MTRATTYQENRGTYSDLIDGRALEKFVVSLSNSELITLGNLLSDRLVQKKLETHCELTDIEVRNFQSLTNRENQVLTLIAKGYTRPEVAEVLQITRNTAATHIASIYRKLDVRSIAEATLHAYRSGLVA